MLSFVGAGAGDYISETTYKYVGVGKGDLNFLAPRRTNWLCWATLALLVILLVVLLLWGTTSTTIKIPGEVKECTFWGDPHVKTFDGGRPSFYGEGEYWIVKNPRVKIQGRYAGTKYTFGLASTQKIAIGGSFIGDHTIIIEPMESQFGGQIRVDGQGTLNSFGTREVGGAIIRYNGEGELVDEATSRWEKNVVHISLPEGIEMEVFRWGNYLDFRIEMAALEDGQDGSCGNFNSDPSDDTTPAIFARLGARVHETECMFEHRENVGYTHQMMEMFQRDCDYNTKERARADCAVQLRGTASDPQLMDACLFDACFGQNEHALQTAKMYASVAEREAVGLA